MPRKRLIVREPCDCIDCRETFPADNLVGTSVAQQQPPPKCLAIYVPNCFEGSRLIETFDPSLELPHITAAVQAGCSGILAIRPDARYSEALDENIILRNLFCQVPIVQQPEAKGAEVHGSALRNLKAEFASPISNSREDVLKAGFTVFHDLSQPSSSHSAEDSSGAAVDLVASRLGLPAAVETNGTGTSAPVASEDHAELLFLHLPSTAAEPQQQDAASAALPPEQQLLLTVDQILKGLNARPGFQETVLLVLLLGIHDSSGGRLPVPQHCRGQDLGLSGYKGVTLPRQSYEFAGLDEVTPDRGHAILCVQRLPYVIRQDGVKQLPETLEGFRPGNGCILAERLFPEIAYKLGRAPKYGA